MKKLIDEIYHHRLFSWLFSTTVFCLRKNLEDCESVLDLGCGPSSPLQYCKNVKYSVGVDIFQPYLEESKRRKIHTEYIEKEIEEVDFPQKSFDAVILIEVLEHLSEEKGYEILKKARKWARKKILVSTPNGFVFQGERDGNPKQKHLSGWDLQKMRSLGFRCWGLAGFKFFHQGTESDIPATESDFTASIRFRPKVFWFTVAAISQLITYYFPSLAFGLFCVKNIKKVQS